MIWFGAGRVDHGSPVATADFWGQIITGNGQHVEPDELRDGDVDRRGAVIDRIILWLAVIVGLVALVIAAVVQFTAASERARTAQEMARLQLSIGLLTQRIEALTDAVDDGTAEGLLALQDRMNRLEDEWTAQPAATATAAAGDNSGRVIDPAWPTEDCIPTGTLFMAMVGDQFPICQSPAVVSVSAITGDTVLVEGAGSIVETGVGTLSDTNCTLTILSADAEGFAEMRVNCK
jgi:HAMP domain-containing protein